MSRWSLRTRLVAAAMATVAIGFLTGVLLVALLASVEADRDPATTRVRGERDAVQTLARRRVLVGGAAATVAAGGIGWVLVGATLTPLERLRAGAAAVAATTDLTRRVPVGSGPDEVDQLGHTINDMLARLQVAERSTQAALDTSHAFAGGAAHELRTPLTSIQVDLETLDNPALGDAERHEILVQIRAEHARLVVLLDQLLALARGDLGRAEIESIDVGDLVEVAMDAARRRSPGVAFSADVVDDLLIEGSAEGVRLAIDNLLENAVRHGAGPIEVSAFTPGDRTHVVVRVDDHGPGLSTEERARVVGRFERGHAATVAGSGLGLALVVQQAELHGGGLALADGPAGGLRAELWLAAGR